jgi:hypothetical protein
VKSRAFAPSKCVDAVYKANDEDDIASSKLAQVPGKGRWASEVTSYGSLAEGKIWQPAVD